MATVTNLFTPEGGSTISSNSIANRLGNADLKPELHNEFELGLEANFFQNRIGIDASYYNKESSDLIIDLTLDPSTGFTRTTINAAALTNEGVELGVNITPFKGDFQWNINLNFTRNRNFVDAIADGVNQVPVVQSDPFNPFAFNLCGHW